METFEIEQKIPNLFKDGINPGEYVNLLEGQYLVFCIKPIEGVKITNLEIGYDTVTFLDKYKEFYNKHYCKNFNFSERFHKIKQEQQFVCDLITKIKTDIVRNVNLSKCSSKGHYDNPEKRIIQKKKKTIFLYKIPIKDEEQLLYYIKTFLNITILRSDQYYDKKLYIFFSLCEIINNLLMYLKILKQTKTNLENIQENKRFYELHECNYKDIVHHRVQSNLKTYVEQNEENNKKYLYKKDKRMFSEYYVISDSNICAVDSGRQTLCSGYVLALSIEGKKTNGPQWNVYPIDGNPNDEKKNLERLIEFYKKIPIDAITNVSKNNVLYSSNLLSPSNLSQCSYEPK
jgi:hypothetical protein